MRCTKFSSNYACYTINNGKLAYTSAANKARITGHETSHNSSLKIAKDPFLEQKLANVIIFAILCYDLLDLNLM